MYVSYLVGLVSLEFAKDLGMPEAFFGSVPVALYTEYVPYVPLDDGEVLLEVALQ